MNKDRIVFVIRKTADRLLQCIFPDTCPICDRILPGGELICRTCAHKLPLIRQPRCMKCGKPLSDEYREYCQNCMRVHHRFTAGECTFLYSGSFRDSVVRMKFQNRRRYIEFYARAMAQVHQPFLTRIRPGVIIPVPMNDRKRKERGFDQCALLGKRLSELTGIPMDTKTVRRVRYTKPQKDLTPEERARNLKGAFSVNKGASLAEPVLLLDDIYTTGATMHALAETLYDAGFKEIYFLALCTTR